MRARLGLWSPIIGWVVLAASLILSMVALSRGCVPGAEPDALRWAAALTAIPAGVTAWQSRKLRRPGRTLVLLLGLIVLLWSALIGLTPDVCW